MLEFKTMRFYKKTLKNCTHPQIARCKKQIINKKPDYARVVYVIQIQFNMHRKACFKVQLDYKMTNFDTYTSSVSDMVRVDFETKRK